ncbi:hexokinase [Brucepastera parasyntrophica]|uniref:hexokinase n=1 Tax=Brucepastera parasyntrophica TaxID=2880008 RepID=UPI00210E55C6|nr:hexokinase [Brucepastera parasyntrophica]ULQ60069.1 hexokinase [Brucepastera parasyntrophica]
MNSTFAVNAFLGRNDFPAYGPDVNSVINTMMYDIEEGLKRDPTYPPGSGPSLDMIPTWSVPPASAPKNQQVIVIDAGGTNFRSCLVTFNETGEPEISQMEKCAMPGSDREYSKKEFFATIASFLDHLKNKATRIGFCFSYSMTITPEGDGKVIRLSKGIKADEVIGTLVGASLSDALVARGWKRPEKITLINDTAAALMAGAVAAKNGKAYDSYVGFILGTGMNAAYIESEKIEKIASMNINIPSSQIVVCESGKCNKIARSRFDQEIDKIMDSPNVFERMCSGAYLGPLGRLALNGAAKDGLFSEPVAKEFLKMESLDLIEMDDFFFTPYKTDTKLGKILVNGTEDDREKTFRLLDAFVERAARLAAANIAAVVIKSRKGTNPVKPVCIFCEGTTFLKTHNLRERVIGYLNTVLTEERGIWFEIVSIDHAVTLGSAVAGLL